MAQDSVDQLVEKWLGDPGFRARMQRDPEGTVKSCGMTLTTEEWATVRTVVMTTGDEALRARISKGPLN